jgi:hypothetical protein
MTKQELIKYLKENNIRLIYGAGNYPVSIEFDYPIVPADNIPEFPLSKEIQNLASEIHINEWNNL